MKKFFVETWFSLLLCALAALSLVPQASAQKADNPIYVTLSFRASFFGTNWQEPGEMSVSLQDETGAWASVWVMGYPAFQWIDSATVTAKLYPNKNYTMSVSTLSGSGYVRLDPIPELPGAVVHINGIQSYNRAVAPNQNQTLTIRVGVPGDFPLDGAPGGLRGGDSSSLVLDKAIWYLGLGRMRSGDSAGAIGFRKPDFAASNFFTRGILYYDAPDIAEVEVIRDTSSPYALRQVFSREVLVDIQDIPSSGSNSYKLNVYPRSQVGAKSGGLWTFSGSPFVTYTVSKVTLTGGSGVKIVRVEDSASWETSLELVSTIWTHRDWRVQNTTMDRHVTTDYTSTTAATVTHSGPPVSGTGTETALVWKKTFTQQSWGKELNTVTFGEGGTTPLVTQYSYYTTTGGGALAQSLKWIKQNNGSWTKFDYNDTSTTLGSRGLVKRTYRQWFDVATTPDAADTTNSTYEDWTYAVAIDGSYRLPYSRIEKAPNGNTLSKTEWAYNHSVTTLNSKTIAQSIRYDYWGSGGTDRLTTTTRYHREDDSSIYHRLKPVSVQHPDGRKDSYAYFNGTWTESTKTFAASPSGDARLVLCYHGQTSGGTAVSTATNNGSTWTMDTVNMVAGKSTVNETVVDIHGRTVFSAENAYTSTGTLERIGGMLFRFDTHGRLVEEVDIARSVGSGSNEFKTIRSYVSGLIGAEVAPDGALTDFVHDDLLRLKSRTTSFSGASGIPDRGEQFEYDGADRVAETYSCSCSTGATIYTYDNAGRVYLKWDQGPNGDLETKYTYSSISSMTTTFPNGATRIAANFLDGRPKSVSGTAQPPATFEYAAESTGMKVTRMNGASTTNGWVEEKHDWLGRMTVRSVPTWGWPFGPGNKVLETRFEYNGLGHLWRERTYYQDWASYIIADRIFEYDAGGRLIRRGLDINNNGQLDLGVNDRIVAVDNTLVKDVWGWTNQNKVNTYATSGQSTATQVSQTNTRLTGFNAGSKAGSRFVTGDVVGFDATGRYSVRWDFADPSASQWNRESEFQLQGLSLVGRKRWTNGYLAESISMTGEKETYAYDSMGRLTLVKGRWDGSNHAEETAYTYHGNSPFVASVTHGGIATNYAFAWDAANTRRKVTVTDAAGKTTHTFYNAMDLPSHVWGSAAQPVQFGYDAVGRRTSMTTWRSPATNGDFASATWPSDPGTGAMTKWLPEPATGLLKEKEWADHTTGDPRKWAYTYNPLGNLASRAWARGVTTEYAYWDGTDIDGVATGTGHVSHRTYEMKKVTYSDGTPTTSYSYKRTGAPDQVTDFTGMRTFAYRSDLQLATETLNSTFYGSNRTITPTYQTGSGGTVNGRANGFEFQDNSTALSGSAFTFETTTGRILTAAGKNGTPPSFTYGYTTGTDWVGSVTSDSFVRTNTLLGNRRVLDIVETKWGATVRSKYDSTFDTSRGLRASIEQSGTIPTGGTTTFTHNDRAELTHAIFSVGTSKDYEWTYDFMGKRTEAKRAGGNATTYSAITDAAKDVNQYASITGDAVESGLAYDKDGNMTQDGTWHYRYDGENRLKEMEKKDGTKTLQFAYDYLNRRVRKTVRNGTPAAAVASSTKFVWSGFQLTSELDAGTAQTGYSFLKSYLWGVDFSNASGAAGGAGALLGVYQSDAWYHTAYDAMGNLTGYLNTSGTAVATYEYNAYGQIIASSGSATSFAFGFATQYTDHESDLVYYGMRYFQPKHGRFINRDPIEEAGGLNLYSFVGNSPSNRWDVLGLSGPAGSVCTDQVCDGAPEEPPGNPKPQDPTEEDPEGDVVVLDRYEFSVDLDRSLMAMDDHELSSRIDESIRERLDQIQVSVDRFQTESNNFGDHNRLGNSPGPYATHHTRHSVEIRVPIGRAMPLAQRLFQALAAFRHFNKSSIAQVTLSRDGRRAYFSPTSGLKEAALRAAGFAGASPVGLQKNVDAMLVRAETLPGHFLVGVRFWGVSVVGDGDIATVRIYTEAHEQVMAPASFVDGLFKEDQMAVWAEYLFNTAIGEGISQDQFATGGVTQLHEVVGHDTNPYFKGGP